MVDSGKILFDQLDGVAGQIRRVCGSAVRIANGFEFFPATGAFDDRAQEICSARTKDKAGANHDRSRISQLRTSLAFKFRQTINTFRSGLIALRVKPILLAIENIVSGNGDESSVYFPARPREIFRSRGVCRKRAIFIHFATVNVGPGGAINNRIRLFSFDNFANPIRIADVEALMIEANTTSPCDAAIIDDRSTHHSSLHL